MTLITTPALQRGDTSQKAHATMADFALTAAPHWLPEFWSAEQRQSLRLRHTGWQCVKSSGQRYLRGFICLLVATSSLAWRSIMSRWMRKRLPWQPLGFLHCVSRLCWLQSGPQNEIMTLTFSLLTAGVCHVLFGVNRKIKSWYNECFCFIFVCMWKERSLAW